MHTDNIRALPQTLATRRHTAGHSSTSARGRPKALQNNTPNSSYQRGTRSKGPPHAKPLSWSVYVLQIWNCHNSVVLSPRAFIASTDTGCTLSTVSPEGYSSVCRGRQEGQILGVPSALNHFILVLPHYHDGKLFSEVSL